MLDSVSKNLPAMMEAFQMNDESLRVDFDWPNVWLKFFEKLDEEVNELSTKSNRTPPIINALNDEVGDIFSSP